MVQGTMKKTASPAKKTNVRPKAAKVKKGARTIAPKQTLLVKQRTMQKKLTANINKNIERQLSVKANAVGKLTIMKKTAETAPDSKKKK